MAVGLRMLVIPFSDTALIRERVGGKLVTYRERFDHNSFGDVPDKVPVRRMHDRSAPVGWAKLTIGRDGLNAAAELVDTQAARDLVVEIRSGLLAGVSVGFAQDPSADSWSLPRRPGTLPEVLRRNVRVVEVSVVDQPAYPSAKVVSVFDTADASHQASEAIMAPFRRQQAEKLAAQRAEDAKLMAELDRLAGKRWTEPEPVRPPDRHQREPDPVLTRTVDPVFYRFPVH